MSDEPKCQAGNENNAPSRGEYASGNVTAHEAGSDENRFDPYGLSEIEKIQQEIERDLNRIWLEEPIAAAPPAEETVPLPEAASMAPDTSVSPVDTTAVRSSEAFYQETIKQKTRRHSTKSWRRTVAVICIICTLGTGSLGFGIGAAIPTVQYYWLGGINGAQSGDNADGYNPYGITSTRYVLGGDDAAPRDGSLSDVINLVEPSVVSVSSVFGNASEDVFNMENTGAGSGIIFSEDTQKIYIATNHHVINGATSVNVSIAGSEPLPAKQVGRDATADLAVISVEKKDMQKVGINAVVIAVFGDSDKMEVGDMVLTIGNAMGEGNSATQGIISAKEKVIPIQGRELTVLQTDAAINFGNSGGPLINVRGEVIGINTAKLSEYYYGSVEGMGYSISSNIAKPILEELMNAGPRPFLGVSGETVSEETAELYGIPPFGVLVRDVYADTGAASAGIARNDIITSFNGNPVLTMDQLADEVKKCKVGDTVEVKILREGKEAVTLQVKLGESNIFG